MSSRHRRTPSLPRLLAVAAAVPVLSVGGAAGAYVAVTAADVTVWQAAEHEATPERPTIPEPRTRAARRAERAAALVTEHACWSGPAPAGAAAGAVVLTRPHHPTTGRPYVAHVTDRATLDAALAHALFGQEREGWKVHAFCRA